MSIAFLSISDSLFLCSSHSRTPSADGVALAFRGANQKRAMAQCRKKQPPPEGTATLMWLVPPGQMARPLSRQRNVISLEIYFLFWLRHCLHCLTRIHDSGCSTLQNSYVLRWHIAVEKKRPPFKAFPLPSNLDEWGRLRLLSPKAQWIQLHSLERLIQLILTLKYNKWCWRKVSRLLGISSKILGPPALVDFSKRRCFAVSQLLNHLEGEL